MNRKLSKLLKQEATRQEENIELIASENYVSKDILKLQGSILTNKYAEGYPGKNIMVVVNILIKLKLWQLNMPANYLNANTLTYNLIPDQMQIWPFIKPY